MDDALAETLLTMLLMGLASVALFKCTVALCTRAGREDAPLLLRACSHALCGSTFMQDGARPLSARGSKYAKVMREEDVESDGLLGAREAAALDPRCHALMPLSSDRRITPVHSDEYGRDWAPVRVAQPGIGEACPIGHSDMYSTGILRSGGLGGLGAQISLAPDPPLGHQLGAGDDWAPSEASACRAEREAEAAQLALEIGPEDSISVAWMQSDPQLSQQYHRPPVPYQPTMRSSEPTRPPDAAPPEDPPLPRLNPAIAASTRPQQPLMGLPPVSEAVEGGAAADSNPPSFVVRPASTAAATPGSKRVTMETPDGTRHVMCVDLTAVSDVNDLRSGMLAAYRDLLGVALPPTALRIHARMGGGAHRVLRQKEWGREEVGLYGCACCGHTGWLASRVCAPKLDQAKHFNKYSLPYCFVGRMQGRQLSYLSAPT